MTDRNDMDLMRAYAAHNSEPSFAELVRRHINLVYSVALRWTGNSADAQDVTQAVFIILAKKSAGLCQRAILTGWLYETTRLTARQFLRTRSRRQVHEQEAYMQSTLNDPGTDGVRRQLAPHLEAGMSRLAERDRTLLALRFYENKTGAEAAALLGIREEAAHKRTARALEKLRQFFTKRGVNSTTAMLAGAISANSVQPAPALLAKSVASVAIVKSAAASASTSALIKGALKLMAWSQVKTAVITGVVLLLATATSTITITEIQKYRHNLEPQRSQLQQHVIKISPNGSIQTGTLNELSQSSQTNGAAARSYGHPVFSISFKIGSGRDAILRQLEQVQATVLNDSPGLLRAEFEKTAAMKRKPMQVELSFIDGKLAKVNYILSTTNAPEPASVQPQ